tara:strand:- start:6046 stop:6822 length:777 start_codon:yes stop_codon:yes gene_type:complete
MLYVNDTNGIKKPYRNFIGTRNIGDFVYSLVMVRHLGGGNFYLSAPQGKYKVEELNPFYKSIPEYFKTLPYINEAGIHTQRRKRMFHIGAYSRVARTERHRNLISCFFQAYKLKEPDKYHPWLFPTATATEYPIIWNKTPRYKDSRKVNYRFLMGRDDVYFVGTQQEFLRIKKNYPKVNHLVVSTFAELVNTINSARVFIGNQSAPLSLAVGLGKNRLLEECKYMPNCTFGDRAGGEEIRLLSDVDVNAENLDRLLKA